MSCHADMCVQASPNCGARRVSWVARNSALPTASVLAPIDRSQIHAHQGSDVRAGQVSAERNGVAMRPKRRGRPR